MQPTSKNPASETRSPEPSKNDPQLELIAWLILCFQPPGREQLEILQDHDPRVLLAEAEILAPDQPPLDLSWRNRQVDDLLPELQEEHVRLFVASRTSPVAYPEALAYFTKHDDERTRFLANLGAELSQRGLRPDSTCGLPPDHLTLILELLYAQGGNLMDGAFVERYLHNWVPEFLDRLTAAEPTAFYRDAARVLAAALKIDRLHLSNPGS